MASVLSRPPVVTTMLSALYFLLMAGTFNSLGVVLPMMVRDIGLSWTQAGFGFTLLGVSCGVSSLLPALTIRRLGVSLTLIMGGLLLCAGFASLALARGTGIYDLGTILLGVGFCFAGSVPATHVIATLYARPGSALGMYFAIGGLGSVSGPLLFYVSALLLSGWRPFWGMAAVASLLAGLGAAACTRVVPHRVERATDDIGPVAVARWTPRAAIRTPQLWIVIASYTASLTVNTTIHSFAVQHLGERGLSLGRAATLFSVAALIGAGASAIAGRLGERVGPRAPTLLAMGSLIAAPLMLALPTGPITLSVFLVAIGIGLGASNVCSATLLLAWFGRRPNLELFSLMCLVSTLAAAGPTVGGAVRDHTGHFDAIFLMLSGFEAVVALGVMLTRAPRPGR